MTLNELTRWLREEIDYLTEHPSGEWEGAWNLLDSNYAITISWEDGFGDIEREDVIQYPGNPDYGLVVGIKVYSPEKEYLEDWVYPWSVDEDGDSYIVTPPTSIRPQEDLKELAGDILQTYKVVVDIEPAEDGKVITRPTKVEPEEDELEPEKEEPVEEPIEEPEKEVEIVEVEPEKEKEELKEGITFEEFNDGEPEPVDFDEQDFASLTQTY